jgi:hypothetical protein
LARTGPALRSGGGSGTVSPSNSLGSAEVCKAGAAAPEAAALGARTSADAPRSGPLSSHAVSRWSFSDAGVVVFAMNGLPGLAGNGKLGAGVAVG